MLKSKLVQRQGDTTQEGRGSPHGQATNTFGPLAKGENHSETLYQVFTHQTRTIGRVCEKKTTIFVSLYVYVCIALFMKNVDLGKALHRKGIPEKQLLLRCPEKPTRITRRQFNTGTK